MSGVTDRLNRLAAIDTCALSDALDKLELGGQVTGLPRQSGEGRVAGIAVTMKLGTGAPPPGPPVHLGVKAIQASDENSIIIIEQRTGLDAGCWGGLLTRGAIHAKVRGVVADGPVRDIDEACELNFPIFTNALTCFTARARVVEKETNERVEIGNVTVSPGDYIIADGASVIVIAPENVERVLGVAEDIIAREMGMIEAMNKGVALHDVLGGNYENMLKKD